VDVGTATAPIYAAQAQGKKFHVYCDETRPRSQGATLTAWELSQQKVPHEIIADNAAGHLMQRGKIDLVIVGSDRTLGRTGEVANKIGTYTKAVLARRHGIPFYVAIPLSTIDWNLKSGFDIPIEERHQSEVLGAWGIVAGGKGSSSPLGERTPRDFDAPCASEPHEGICGNSPLRLRGRGIKGEVAVSSFPTTRFMGRSGAKRPSTLQYVLVANPTSTALNPGFDVTPAELITGIITPAGIFKPRELWARRRELGWLG